MRSIDSTIVAVALEEYGAMIINDEDYGGLHFLLTL